MLIGLERGNDVYGRQSNGLIFAHFRKTSWWGWGRVQLIGSLIRWRRARSFRNQPRRIFDEISHETRFNGDHHEMNERGTITQLRKWGSSNYGIKKKYVCVADFLKMFLGQCTILEICRKPRRKSWTEASGSRIVGEGEGWWQCHTFSILSSLPLSWC